MTRSNARALLALGALSAAMAAARASGDQSADCANPWWKDSPTDQGRTYTVTFENVTGAEIVVNFTKYYYQRNDQGRCVRRTAPYPNASTTYTIAVDETRTLTLANFPGCALRIREVAPQGVMINVYEERQLGRIDQSLYDCSGGDTKLSVDGSAMVVNPDVEMTANGGDECPCECSLDSTDDVCVGSD